MSLYFGGKYSSWRESYCFFVSSLMLHMLQHDCGQVFDTVDGRNPGKVEACKTLETLGLWDDCLSSINPSTFPKAIMSLATKPSQKEKIFQPSIFNRYLTFKKGTLPTTNIAP